MKAYLLGKGVCRENLRQLYTIKVVPKSEDVDDIKLNSEDLLESLKTVNFKIFLSFSNQLQFEHFVLIKTKTKLA